MKNFKENLPLILLVVVVPYFFYASPTIPQAIIATALAFLSGFKYYLEFNAHPNYKEMFEDQLKRRDEAIFLKNLEMSKDIEALREKQSIRGLTDLHKTRRDTINW